LGVLLDLAMRDFSHDQASLRDLFRSMNDHYAKQGKFFADTAAVEQSAKLLSHADLQPFFEQYVRGTDEIPWDRFFVTVGLHVIKTEVAVADPGFDAAQQFDQPLVVVRVYPGSEAEHAGLKPDDVILQSNEKPAGRDFENQLAALAPGATLRLLIRRGGAQQQLHWKLGSRSQPIFHLQDVSGITPQQKSRRSAWLFGDFTTSQ
jgi:predicted metalloprotease with PDZ domain